MSTTKHKTAIYFAIWQALSFVLMGIWIRLMSDSFTVNQQVFWRLFLAFIAAWVVFGRKFNKNTFKQIRNKDWFIYLLRSILNYSVGVFLFTIAVLNSNLAVVSFISSLPIMGLLAWLFFREKLDIKALPFILVSIIGLFMVSGVDGSNFVIGMGILAAIVSMLGFDISYLLVKYHPKKLNNFHNTTLILSFSWIVPLIVLIFNNEPILPTDLSALALIGLVGSIFFNIIGLYTLNYIFSNLKAYVAGNILLLEGVFAAIIGYVFYKEQLSLQEIFGASIIILCAYQISRFSMKQQKAVGGEI